MKKANLMRTAVLVLATLFVGNLGAQTTPSCTQFLAPTEWTGTFTLTGTGSGTSPAGDSYSVNESITASPDLTSAVGGPDWKGTFNEIIHIDDTLIDSDGFLVAHITDDEMLTKGANSAVAQLFPALGINPAACSFEFDYDATNNEVSTNGNGGVAVGGATGVIGGYSAGTFSVGSGVFAGPLPASGTTISAGVTLSAFSQIGPAVNWTITLSLTPKQDLDLIVTIPGYSTWRPTGNHNEKEVGFDPVTGREDDRLEIDALLVNKTTQQPVDFPPDNVTFQLVEVSHEPGVVLNWPPQGTATNDPDMTFDPKQNPNCMIVGFETCTFTDPVTLEVVPNIPPNILPVSVFLSPHDWGGWANLHVFAKLGTQTITGHMLTVSDPNNSDILLPQRQPDSHVADSWKIAHGIALTTSDTDDSENSPVGDGQPGDGFTMYEEYRGFYMGCSNHSNAPLPEGARGCQHAEGDPKTKDFFVVNQIGDHAVEGIGLFQFGSGLNVHYRGLTLAEIGPKGSASYRVINFNHSAGVPQHAVILTLGPSPDAGASSRVVSRTKPTPDFVCGIPSGQCGMLPKHADHIEISPALLGSDYQSAEVRGGYLPIDISVAHELSHSVDVYHHGDGVDHYEFWTLGPDNQTIMMQRLGPHSLLLSSPQPIIVAKENGSLTGPQSQGILGILDLGFVREGNPIDPNDPNRLLPGRQVRVGNCINNGQVMATGGESSGDVLDVMRYDDTEAYIPVGFPFSRIWIEDIAFAVDLTDQPLGTGENASSNKPRPHFGDADTTHLRGKDRSQVDVNDGHTEIQRGQLSCSGT